jgi:GxGYxYP putative glycoside hydrolase C-terminal domain/GxGYxY sequence motif in domain of unknown function N-terminal
MDDNVAKMPGGGLPMTRNEPLDRSPETPADRTAAGSPEAASRSFDRRRFLGTSAVVGGSTAVAVAAGLAAGGPAGAAPRPGPHKTAVAKTKPSTVLWPPSHSLPIFGRAKQLDVIDLRKADGDLQTLLVTLQGVVNRSRPRLYFYLQGDETDPLWLETLGTPHTATDDAWSLVAKYIGEAAGLVVYDPDVPDSVNVATIIAGIHGGVVASPDLATTLAAAPYNVSTIDDLRGRFAGRVAAYQWALDNLWSQTSHKLITAVPGTSTQAVPGVTWTELAKVTSPVTDSSNKDTYTLDLSGQLGTGEVYLRFADAYTNDGWGPAVQQLTVKADGVTIADFQPGSDAETPYVYDLDSSQASDSGWRFADGSSSFTYLFKPPAGTTSLTADALMWNEYDVSATDKAPTKQVASPYLRDYIIATNAFICWLDPLVEDEAALFTEILSRLPGNTPYLGWFTGGHESDGVTLCAAHGVYVLAADFWTNGSVLGGARAPIKKSQPRAHAPRLENKVYVTLTMSEGDNLQYCEHRLRDLWDDPARGSVPINWSISPLLADAAPALMHYFQASQTPNDLLLAGPSGAGYTYPDRWPAADLEKFTTNTGQYLRRTGMDVIYTLNRNGDANEDLAEPTVRSYLRHARLQGILGNWVDTSYVKVTDGLPIVTQIGISSVDQGVSTLATATADWDGNSPLFVGIGVLAWNMTPADVKALVTQIADKYSVVRGDVFLRLVRSSGQGK